MLKLIKMNMFRIILVLFLVSCSNAVINEKSENYDSRVRYLIIHYTSENFAESLRLLTQRTDRPVSAHYLIPESNDLTYTKNNLHIYQLVDENNRAWHAGLSYWGGERGLNDNSIGIEIVNASGCDKSINQLDRFEDLQASCNFKEFDGDQIDLVVNLLQAIIERHPDIKPNNIVGHSDIAPDRKIDPGPLFPWFKLYERGFGAWYEASDYEYFLNRFNTELPSIMKLQEALANYGYEIEATGVEDKQSKNAVRAFQLHFRPNKYDGLFDLESAAIIYALNKKYKDG
jgi:N-acetyl-anhydromuramyl-L-alanine amidase AmpD